MLGVAVAALTSCTNEEVTEVAQNRAITFSNFVNNNTKAVTGLDADKMSTNFYVIGYYGAEDNVTTPVFENEISTTTYYWIANNHYQFAAYANGIVVDDGNAEDIKLADENVTYTAGNNLTISNYSVNDKNDLVAAISTDVNCSSATGNTAVGLTFYHLLSKVCFTFTSPVGENYTLKISGLKFNAKSTGAKCEFDGTTATWSEGANADYSYEEIEDLTVEENEQADGTYMKTVEKLAIPQAVPSDNNQIEVSFTATISGTGLEEKSANLSGTLSVPSDNAWKAGYVYNYTTEITAEKIDPSLENQKITFTVNKVEEWNTTWNSGNDEVPVTTNTKQN